MKVSRRCLLLSGAAFGALFCSVPACAGLIHRQGSSFNGGKTQVNFQFPNGNSGEYPFLNLLKSGGTWQYVTGGNGPVLPTNLDANGYPTTIPGGTNGQFLVTFIPSNLSRPGNYAISWDGNGTIIASTGSPVAYSITAATNASQAVLTLSATNGGVTGALTAQNAPAVNQTLAITGAAGGTWSGLNTSVVVQSVNLGASQITVNINSTGFGTYTGSSGAAANSPTNTNGVGGRYMFLPSTAASITQINVGIASVGSPIITNMKFYHIDDEVDLAAGKVFGKQFLLRLQQANFGVYRFLNWGWRNTSNTTIWANRKPSGYVTWAGQELRSNLWCTPLTNIGRDYSITGNGSGVPASGAPADKMVVLCNINTSITNTKPSVTFNVGASSITWATHGLSLNDPVGFQFNGGNQFPTPLSNSGNYYVSNVIDANTIQISATSGGASITFGGSQSGTIYGSRQPTLSLNGTTAIPVKNSVGVTFGISDIMLANVACSFIYDAELGSWLMFGGNTTEGGIYLNDGIPPDICLQLCAQTGAHPYWVEGYMMCAPITDYSAGLANLCAAHSAAKKNGGWMVPRFETLNELWNTNANPTNYCISKAQSYTGWSATSTVNFMNMAGKASSLLGQAINAVYGGTPSTQTNYQVICGVQTTVFTSLPIHSQDPRLTSDLYVSTQGGSAASNWVTHVCCAQYLTPFSAFNGTEATYAVAYAGCLFNATISGTTLTISSAGNILTSGGAITAGATLFGPTIPAGVTLSGATITSGSAFPATMTLSQNLGVIGSQSYVVGSDLTAPTSYVASLSGTSAQTFTLQYVQLCYQNISAWAAGLGVTKMCGYEGGYSPDYSVGGIATTPTNLLRWSGKNESALQGFTTTNYNNFIGAPTGGNIAEFPSCFQLGGQWPSANAWSILEDVYQNPLPPQFLAIQAFH